jgi:hypothetical protein
MYHWGSRETNYLGYSYQFSSGEDYSNLIVDMFWDREKGILTELSFEAELQQNGTFLDASASWIIIESNMEDIPEFIQPALILIIVTVTLLISIFKKKGNIRLTPSN